MIFNLQQITKKQEHVVSILSELRGLRYDQMIDEWAARMGRDVGESFRKNNYKDLRALENMKLINREPFKYNSHNPDFIYLTEAGLECACELLNIPFGHIGTGWNEDWGDFPYDLYRPPRPASPAFNHHMMLTDVLLAFGQFKRKFPELQLDFRDNRYCSREFVQNGQPIRFRPDADVLYGDRGERYLVEVDRGTEFGEKMREKFGSYDGYLRHLRDNGEPLPAGVIFIMNKQTPAGIARRWSLIDAAFKDQMQEWATEFNLIGGSVEDIESILLRQVDKERDFKDFFDKVSQYKTPNVSVAYIKDGIGITWSPAPISIAISDEENRFYAYERYEPLETLSVSRIYAWAKWFEKEKKNYGDLKNALFVPVLWSPESAPNKLMFKGFELEKEYNEIFGNVMWLKTDPHPQWFNKTGELFQGAHPLTESPL